MFIIVCLVRYCTARSSGLEWTFLCEDAPLTFSQRSKFCELAALFQTSRWPVDRSIRPLSVTQQSTVILLIWRYTFLT